MNHRKNTHTETVAPCRNYNEGKCSYTDNKCWWKHDNEQEGNIRCFICSQLFGSKSQLMIHRQKEHEQLIRPCVQFQQNNCRFKDNTCWFKHEMNGQNDDEEVAADSKTEDISVFQKASEILKPPINNQMKNQNKKENL